MILLLVTPLEERSMPISRNQEEAERDLARAIAELEAQGYGVQGAASYQAPDGSVSWTICPGLPLREPTPEEAEEARKAWEALERRAAQAPCWTPSIPEWLRGDK